MLEIGAPGNLSELRALPIPGAIHLIGFAIQGNRALAVASSGGWQDFFNNQNAGLSGNVVLATLDVSDPRNRSDHGQGQNQIRGVFFEQGL